MDSTCVGTKGDIDWDQLSSRFPDLGFLLSLETREPLVVTEKNGTWNTAGSKGLLYDQDGAQEAALWRQDLSLDGVDVLYVYGIGLGYHYEVLRPWLEEKKERVVVFLEDDLPVFQIALSLPLGRELLSHPQVHVAYISEPRAWSLVLDQCVRKFMSDRVDLVAIASYKRGQERKLRAHRLSLLRKATLVYVGMTELVQYHLLLRNIVSNALKMPESFHVNQLKGACQGIPAVICGAGVSLSQAIATIRSLENKAIIIAGGSAITALGRQGISPHIAIALDPNDEEYTRLKGSSAFETPFIYSARLDADVLSCMNVKPGYLYSETGGVFESWLHEQLSLGHGSLGPELGMEALSVTTLAVPLARHLGCGPILFCGVDLSYQNKERYSPGVLSSSQVFLEELKHEQRAMERPVLRKNRLGKKVYTLVKWVMEASCIGSYTKKHGDCLFFSASQEGLPIPQVPFLSIEAFAHTYCQEDHDLRGLLHAQGEEARFDPQLKSSLHQLLADFVRSLKKSLCLLEEMLFEIEAKILDKEAPEESGKMSLIQMDLEQEVGYTACLQYAFSAYARLLERVYPSLGVPTREQALEKRRHLWQEGKRVAEETLALFVSLKLVAQSAEADA